MNYLVSLSKLREYHGSFKSVCDNYAIDESEFSHIFQINDYNIFKLWDTEKNGLIDALEIFSGLILFTTARFEDKVRCKFLLLALFNLVLFDLFDFNELNSLALIDIAFMIECCLNSTFKIYNIKTEVND